MTNVYIEVAIPKMVKRAIPKRVKKEFTNAYLAQGPDQRYGNFSSFLYIYEQMICCI